MIDTSDNDRSLQLIGARGWKARTDSGKILLPSLSRVDAGAINSQLVGHGITVHEIIPHKKDLEQIFLSLVLE